jgi:hypothetical protein
MKLFNAPAVAIGLLASLTLAACSSGGGKTSESNPVPTLTSVSPASIQAGSPTTTITAAGSNFLPSSTVMWNGSAFPTSYTSSTAITAQVSAADLQAEGSATVKVVNPPPGGGWSEGVTLMIGAPGVTVLGSVPNDLAWDPVNQVIYFSFQNTVEAFNPATGTFGVSASIENEPFLLSISQTSEYLYVSQMGASTVQVMTLPNLDNEATIQLGSDPYWGPLYALDLQAAPNSDDIVGVVRGTPVSSPAEVGGAIIYQNGTALPDVLCGFGALNCLNTSELFDTIQWKSDGTQMYAANNETTGFDFYTIPVTSSGFGGVTDYPGLLPGFYLRIHYDATTGYVYDDDGYVVDPSNGTVVEIFPASGLVIPDGKLGKVFILGQTQQESGTSTYTLESFDIQRFTPIGTLTIPNVVGFPTNMVRWGTNGLAFITNTQVPPLEGATYIISSSFVSGSESADGLAPVENVHRTWKMRRSFGNKP